ncbi:MAG: hypothetical protein HFJ11_06105, partial [Bacilli bacterium]|nr:hypothetical protein [Bacilli bacterium]
MKIKKLIIFIVFLAFSLPMIIKAEEKNGWYVENNETYYYENGKKASGFKEIEGETYFFGLTTNKMLKGWQSVAEGRFYLNSEGKIKQGWNEIDGEKYYVENNYMVSGFKEIDGETYFFGLTTNKMLKGWQSVAEGRFYINNEGKIKQGWNEINKEKYYVENNYMVSGFKEIDGETYFFGLTTNKMLKGWQSVAEGRFYLNSE